MVFGLFEVLAFNLLDSLQEIEFDLEGCEKK